MSMPISKPRINPQTRTASAIASTISGGSAAAVALRAAHMPADLPVDQAALRQFTRGGAMGMMAFLSAAGHTYAAVNDFQNGHHVKGFIRAVAAAGSAVSVVHAASGGRVLASMAVPGLFVAAACGVAAKVMDQGTE